MEKLKNIKNVFLGHKKILIAGGTILTLLLGYNLINGAKDDSIPISESEVTIVEKKDFMNSVSETGVLKSENESKIYPEKPLQIKEVLVKVGDKVEEGQVIATLDDSNVEQQIAQKRALIAQSKRNVGAQVNSASGRLNEAIKNRENGTNPQIVAAESSVLSAYDAWQTAEKNYEDFKRGVNIGYNEQIQAQRQQKNTLDNQLNQSNLNYNQSREKINELRMQIAENSSLASNTERNIANLKGNDRNIDIKLNELNNELKELQSKLEDISIPPIGEKSKENGIDKSKDSINTSDIRTRISSINKQIQEKTFESQDNKSQIAKLEADLASYRGKIEAANSSLSPTEKELEQHSLAIETANKSIGEHTEQQVLSDKAREDQSESLRKTALDLKNTYESSLKSLKTAEVTADNEIKSLKDNLNIASASSDTKVNSVDLKFLLEEKTKSEIKAPISGTVTEVNMVKGQAPTDYVAKVETIERTLINSQVKEFDLNNISLGMEVEVTTESSDEIYRGRVESINPIPKKPTPDAQGANQEVVYETKVSLIDSADKSLQPGMSVRLKYVLEKQEGVITVPSTAIYTKNDKSFVLCIPDRAGIIEEREVKLSTKNEYESVIESDELSDGTIVINSPDMYSSGAQVKVVEEVDGNAENN